MLELTPEEIEAIRLSLKVSVLAVSMNLPVAIAGAWILARWRFPGKSLVDALAHLPLVLPPVVTGYVLLLLFGRHGPVGAWLHDTFGITVAFRWTGAAIAASVMGFPLVLQAIRLSFEALDRRLEQSAATLGASPARIFLTVSLPQALPGVLAGAILGFAKSLGEFGATITFVSNIPGKTQTLALAIFSHTQTPGEEAQIATLRLTAVAFALSLISLLASGVFARRIRQRSHGHDA